MFGGNEFKPQSHNVFKLYLQRPGSEESIEIVATSFPVICSSLPTPINLTQFAHLKDLELADCPDNPSGAIDVLICSDFYWNVVGKEVIRGDKGPIAVKSKLGWLVSGPIFGIPQPISNVVSKALEDSIEGETLRELLNRFWETEAIDIQAESNIPAINGDTFLKNIKYENTHYEVSLPWKHDCADLCSHFNLSYNRLRYLRRRLLRQPEVLNEYDKIIYEQLHNGIIERVYPTEFNDPSMDKGSHYLSHHTVVKEERKTTKV